MLHGRKIILGVTGSIAAYKAAVLVRELVKSGAEVKVLMTDAARDFVTPLTLATLSKHPVLHRFTEDESSGDWNNHVELGLWADAFLIAPCSANTLAKMHQGLCDNLLMATYLSARCEVFVAPAMDLDMYAHHATQENIQGLESKGVHVIYPQEGELASGLSGKGRMTEPEDIRKNLEAHFSRGIDLSGKRVLITAGPTYEDLDPVRYLGNRSTGKMGFALARACANAGAQVSLVAGPVQLELDHPLVERTDVRSAQDMFEACNKLIATHDILIMAAAVADYRPATRADHKLKKSDGDMQLSLERTQDILAALGEQKQAHQRFVGFALESDKGIDSAKSKLERKHLDMIVLNSLKDAGAGFAHDTNRITILDKDNRTLQYELKSKDMVAIDILQHLQSMI